MNGLVHIYTGNGKGKTSAAIGLAIRAYGNGHKILFSQFFKSTSTGEINVLENLRPNVVIIRTSEIKGFTWNMNEEQISHAKKVVYETFDSVKNQVSKDNYDVLILDEIIGTLNNGFLSCEQVLDFLENKPQHLEVVMTGRNAPQELIDFSDYVSEIKEIKHPYQKGIHSRKGIEY